MSTATTVRSQVREAYARAITQTASGPAGCCSGCPTATELPSSLPISHARVAGYTEDQLADRSPDLASGSFGCGNPVAFAGVRPGQTVLDLGCGGGLDLILAAEQVGPEGRVIGVDMTPEMLERARANVTRAGLADIIELRQGFIEELPVSDASVDHVVSNCVLSLSPEKHLVFSEIHRVLKPGGRMLISDVVAEDLPAHILALPGLHESCVAGALSEAAFIRGLEASGLEDVTVLRRYTYDAAQLLGMVEGELQGLIGALPRAFLLEQTRQLAGKIASVTISARKPLA